MELTEYYLNLVDQFFLIEKLEYEDNSSVDTLHKAVEEIVLTMNVIRDVYPEFQSIWGSYSLSQNFIDLERCTDPVERKDLFVRTRNDAMVCSKVVIPRF